MFQSGTYSYRRIYLDPKSVLIRDGILEIVSDSYCARQLTWLLQNIFEISWVCDVEKVTSQTSLYVK